MKKTKRDLAYYKGVVVTLQLSLKDETVPEFLNDILAAIQFVKARVRLLERQAGIRGEPLWK